jgi:predicted dehydrogenase
VLDRGDIDAVVIGTPDHWHAKILIDAMKAGKDAYCEKPMTLTIDEGKLIGKVARDTGRVVQVGTQQRSDHNRVFLLAVAMVRAGRIGKVKTVTAAIGGGPAGGPFPEEGPPSELNWDMWLGQAPKVEYIKQRCHGDFRWWYEYSGGKLTDWGAHHVDIGQWAIGQDDTGPTTIEVVKGELPVEYKDGWPRADDRYNTATAFMVKAMFPNGVEMNIRDDTENGVTFDGEDGRIFVTRDRIDLSGGSVDALRKDPVEESLLVDLRKGKKVDGHMPNFFECMADRSTPVSDVWSHHRALTTCHLANIAIRLGGRKLNWDPAREEITGDAEANRWLTRPQRSGYEVTA